LTVCGASGRSVASDSGTTAHLLEDAEAWAGLGDRDNYRQSPAADDQVMITYERPTPLSEPQQKRIADAATYLTEQGAYAWAAKSLSQNKPADGWSLDKAVEFAKERDFDALFEVRRDVGGHAVQSAVSAIAACAIRFQVAPSDQAWAWDVMSRVERMVEPDGFSGSKIPWHPTIRLVVALVHDRRSKAPRPDSAERLLKLVVYPLEDIAELAFKALFMDADDHVRWVAAQLAMDLSLYWHPIFGKDGERDSSAGQHARETSLSRAVANLAREAATPFPDIPPAWVKTSRRQRRRSVDEEEDWGEPDPSFSPQFAAKVFVNFPVEAWCGSSAYRPFWQAAISKLVIWTAERLMPPWHDSKMRRDRPTDLIEWNATFGDLLARSAPFFETSWVRQHLLAPFLMNDENALRVLSEFADKTVTRHVLDAENIPKNTLDLLSDCADRVLIDRMFNPQSYRAGEVNGQDMPQLVKALLLVAVERASGAARFVNGDWSQVGLMMPLITKLVSAIGWSPFVMQHYLTLCERAGLAYPIEAFAEQTRSVLSLLPNAKGGWTGTSLPARIAGIIQRLADSNYPLRFEQAYGLLWVLDALIDLGDRRSVALEQTEAFRSVQLRSA
jgi:hypothetical protein